MTLDGMIVSELISGRKEVRQIRSIGLTSGVDIDKSGGLRILEFVDSRYEIPIIKGEKGICLHLQQDFKERSRWK